jgi:hypothetical protein
MMSLSALILMGPLIYVIIKLRRKVLKMFGEESRNYKMSECVWFTYGAIMKQGSPLEPSDGLFLGFVQNLKPNQKVFLRHNEAAFCNVVDFHHYFHFLLHCKFDCFFDPVQIFTSLGAPRGFDQQKFKLVW